MHSQYVLKKEDLDRFIRNVMGSFDLIAPVEKDDTRVNGASRFAKINSPDEISYYTLTQYPAKFNFLNKEETLFKFQGSRLIDPVIKLNPTVIFGLRRCDLNAINHQDMVFLLDDEDPFYRTRRNMCILMGLHCLEGDDYCFCNSVEQEEFGDLMFYDRGSFFAVEVLSKKGADFITRFQYKWPNQILKGGNILQPSPNIIAEEDKKIFNTKTLNSTEIHNEYDNEEWDKLSNKCLSCGACNHLCPNCHCFYIRDNIKLDLKNGQRIRLPSSCLQRRFTRVAGNNVFRITQLARFKHRIYHQLQYFKERHGTTFCTGCGRCIRYCPTKIDWVDAINRIKNERIPNKE